MPISINSTPASLFSQSQLTGLQNNLQTSNERLSSGLRINRAKDDAAGLAIAVRLATELLGSQTAIRNTNDGLSLAQTADGAITEASNITQRIRELAVQSSNGTLSDDDRASLQAEVEQLQEEAGRIFSTTEFNGVSLLGNNDTLEFQVGSDNGDLVSLQTRDLNAQLTGEGFFAVDVSTAAGAQSALGVLDTSLNTLSETRGEFGAVSNRFESIVRGLEQNNVDTAASQSRILDADFARETANRTRDLIQQNATLGANAQANASANLVSTLLNQ